MDLNHKFKALVSRETEHNHFSLSVEMKSIAQLPQNEVLVNVKYSSLNFKDGLSARGNKGISRNYPHTPGVDAAGVVVSSLSPIFKKGDEVIITGHDLGMNTDGGFAQFISVPAKWCVKMPIGLDLKTAMKYGTAGQTAGMCVNEILGRGITPDKGKILITGATGAVGCIAVAFFAKLGYHVVASTGKADQHDYLFSIGAKEIIQRKDVYDESGKLLLEKKWIAAVDTVGGNTLSTIIRSLDYHGVACVLGLVESPFLAVNLYPFLLRGITIFGIDSAERELHEKISIWNKIAAEWSIPYIDEMCKEVALDDIIPEIDLILAGKQYRKVLINCQ